MHSREGFSVYNGLGTPKKFRLRRRKTHKKKIRALRARTFDSISVFFSGIANFLNNTISVPEPIPVTKRRAGTVEFFSISDGLRR